MGWPPGASSCLNLILGCVCIRVRRGQLSKKLFGRTQRKRNWGRNTRIDSWEKLQLVIELMKSGLPIDVTIDLYDAEVSESVLHRCLTILAREARWRFQHLCQSLPRSGYRFGSTKHLHGCYEFISASTSYLRRRT